MEDTTENRVALGSGLKISIKVDAIDGLHIAQLDDFTVRFYTSTSSSVELHKADLIPVDDDTFIACIDTSLLKAGVIRCRVIADVPDYDFKMTSYTRREICDTETPIILQK